MDTIPWGSFAMNYYTTKMPQIPIPIHLHLPQYADSGASECTGIQLRATSLEQTREPKGKGLGLGVLGFRV